ncbi:MAG: nitroreductase family protein [Oscillospiraceae bacterium]|nr:nitroreductase family protein [Oscillospiraceae bacterium]MDD4368732.1 nitroreductase family protein [Oscillospiraceae bacterium]
MDILTLVQNRHSYRGLYKADPVPREDLTAILTAGLAAPSGCNQQTTRLLAIDEPQLLAKLREVLKKPSLCSAPALICVLTNPREAYPGHCFARQDYAAAIENMLLAIVALGYQSCWYEGYLTNEDQISRQMAQLLKVPPPYELVCVLPVGEAAASPAAPPAKLPFDQRAWFNRLPSQGLVK